MSFSNSSSLRSKLFAVLTTFSLLASAFVAPFLVPTVNADSGGAGSSGSSEKDNEYVEFIVTKTFDGDSQGYSASDFYFRVTGGLTNTMLPHGSTTMLAEGTYVVEEVVPNGFVKEDWEVTWSGDCVVDDSDQFYADFEITDDDVAADTGFSCEAENKYVGGDDNNGGGGDEDDEWFELEKKFSGPVPKGYTANQFTFNVEGEGVVSLEAYTDDIAYGYVDLEAGVYEISENGPDGFVLEDWVIQWSGPGCESVTAPTTTLVIDESDVGLGNFGCRADNQWKPGGEEPVLGCTDSEADNYNPVATPGNEDENECEYDNGGEEPVLGCTDSEADNYNPVATPGNDDADDCEYDSGGEDPVPGCTDEEALNFEAEATEDDDSCIYGNGGGEGRYKVFGYVWHDENENDEWDGVDNEDPDTEDELETWVVSITNGEDTATTTTDGDGYYEFWVPAGTWTINEVVMDGWVKTFPNENGHVVEVIDEQQAQAEGNAIFATIVDYIIPTAHAQTPTTYGPFNFGNVLALACDLSISQNSVASGATVTLAWDTWNANTVVIDNGIGTTTATGSVDKVVTTNTTYTLTATDQNGQVTCDQSVTILGGGGPTSNPGPTGGGGERISLSDGGGGSSSGSSSDDADGSDPIPQVLGDQVSVVPAGAPNAGAGGAAQTAETSWLEVVLSWFGLTWFSA